MVDCNDYQNPFKKLRCLVHTLGEEEMCFYNGMHLLFIKPKKDKQRPLKIDSPFRWDNVKIPPTKEDLKKFEKNNNLHLIVFGYEKEAFYNFYLSKFEKHRHDSNSFLFVYHEGHFITIVNKAAFFDFLDKKHRYVYSIPFLQSLK